MWTGQGGGSTVDSISIVRDLIVSAAAVITAWAAWRGINQWTVELRGRTNFEVARGLILATYKVRDEVRSCRAMEQQKSEFPDDYPIGQHQTPEQRAEMWTHVLENRCKLVRKALQHYRATVLDAEACWGCEIRYSTGKLLDETERLFDAMSHFIEDKRSDGRHFGENRELSSDIAHTVFIISSDNDQLSRSINAAVAEIEDKVRKHM